MGKVFFFWKGKKNLITKNLEKPSGPKRALPVSYARRGKVGSSNSVNLTMEREGGELRLLSRGVVKGVAEM